MSALDDLMTRADIADALDLSVRTIENLARKDAWEHVRVGKRIKYTPAQVEKIIKRYTVVPPRPAAKGVTGQTSRSAARSAKAAS